MKLFFFDVTLNPIVNITRTYLTVLFSFSCMHVAPTNTLSLYRDPNVVIGYTYWFIWSQLVWPDAKMKKEIGKIFVLFQVTQQNEIRQFKINRLNILCTKWLKLLFLGKTSKRNCKTENQPTNRNLAQTETLNASDTLNPLIWSAKM